MGGFGWGGLFIFGLIVGIWGMCFGGSLWGIMGLGIWGGFL